MRPGDKAWLVLAGGILVWDMIAPPGELLSEAADRYLETHPILTRAVIAVVALHLANILPPRIDPVHQCFIAARLARDTIARRETSWRLPMSLPPRPKHLSMRAALHR